MIVFGMNLHPNSSCIPKLWLFQTVFPPRLSSMRASPSTRQPPTWLGSMSSSPCASWCASESVQGHGSAAWVCSSCRRSIVHRCRGPRCHRGIALTPSSSDTATSTAASPSARDAIKGSSGTKSSELGRYTHQHLQARLRCPYPHRTQSSLRQNWFTGPRQPRASPKQPRARAISAPALRHQINHQFRLQETHDPRPDDERLSGIGVHSRGVSEHHGMLRGKGADLRQSGSVSLRSGELGLGRMMDDDHDYWEKGKNKLTRHRNMPRLLLYNLHHQDCPIPKHLLWSECRAEVQYEDGTFETVQYDWRSHQETQLKMPWTGRTVFTIQNSNNQSTGHRPSIISRSKAERAAQRLQDRI